MMQSTLCIALAVAASITAVQSSSFLERRAGAAPCEHQRESQVLGGINGWNITAKEWKDLPQPKFNGSKAGFVPLLSTILDEQNFTAKLFNATKTEILGSLKVNATPWGESTPKKTTKKKKKASLLEADAEAAENSDEEVEGDEDGSLALEEEDGSLALGEQIINSMFGDEVISSERDHAPGAETSLLEQLQSESEAWQAPVQPRSAEQPSCDLTKCMVTGSPDKDCCGQPGHGAGCSDGYVYSKGESCYGGLKMFKTCCTPPPPTTTGLVTTTKTQAPQDYATGRAVTAASKLMQYEIEAEVYRLMHNETNDVIDLMKVPPVTKPYLFPVYGHPLEDMPENATAAGGATAAATPATATL